MFSQVMSTYQCGAFLAVALLGATGCDSEITPRTLRVDIESPASGGALEQQDITVEGTTSGTAVVTSVSLSLDDGAFETAIGTTAFSLRLAAARLPPGPHVLLARASSEEADDATARIEFTILDGGVDVDPPQIALLSPEEGFRTNGLLEVQGTASDNVAVTSVSFSLDGAPPQSVTGLETWTISVDSTVLGEGNHELQVSAVDAAGNVGRAIRAFVVDRTAPVAIVAPFSTPTSALALDWDIEGDDVAEYRFAVDDSPSQGPRPIDDPLVVSVEEGTRRISIWGIDAAGNVQQSPTVETVEVDRTAPSAVLTAPPPLVSSETTLVSDVAGDGVVAYRFRVDDDPLSAAFDVSEALVLEGLQVGSHALRVLGIDAAGNAQVEANATVYEWTVEEGALTAVLSQAPAPFEPSRSVNLLVGGSRVASYRFSLDEGAYGAVAPISSPLQISDLAEGAHSLRVLGRTSDGEEQDATTPTTLMWVVDTRAPTLLVDEPIEGQLLGGTVLARGASEDAQGTLSVECAVDDAAFLPASGTASWTHVIDTAALSDGNHLFRVRAHDQAGNVTVVERSMIIDNTPPVVDIATPLPNTSVSTSFVIEGTVDELHPLEGLFWRVDGGVDMPFSPGEAAWTLPIDVADLATGLHRFEIRALDRAGNEGIGSLDVFVDNEVPSVTISAPTEAEVLNNPVTATGTSADNVGIVAVEFAIDNGPFVAASGTEVWSAPIDTTALADGGHTLTVRGLDAAGNAGLAPVVSFFVDRSPPTLTVVEPLAGMLTNRDIGFSGTASDASGVASVDYQIDGSGFVPAQGRESWSFTVPVRSLSQGAHSAVVRATDFAGTTTEQAIAFSVDTLAPTAVFAAGLPGDPSDSSSLNIVVGGLGVVAYDYRLDDGAFVEDIPLSLGLVESDLENGPHRLQLWGKDALGNRQRSATTYAWTVAASGPTLVSADPVDGSWLRAPDPIVLTFDEPVVPASVVIRGSLTDDPVDVSFSQGNTVLTLDPQPLWRGGFNNALIVDVEDAGGTNKTTTLHYEAETFPNRFYVSPAGDDANSGDDPTQPFRTLAQAQAAANGTSSGRGIAFVAEGSYPETLDVDGGTVRFYGGYSANFEDRDPTVRTSVIDPGPTMIGVECTNVGSSTVLDGFTVRGSLPIRTNGSGASRCAMVARHLIVEPTREVTPTSSVAGIFVRGGSAPVLQDIEIRLPDGHLVVRGLLSTSTGLVMVRDVTVRRSSAIDGPTTQGEWVGFSFTGSSQRAIVEGGLIEQGNSSSVTAVLNPSNRVEIDGLTVLAGNVSCDRAFACTTAHTASIVGSNRVVNSHVEGNHCTGTCGDIATLLNTEFIDGCEIVTPTRLASDAATRPVGFLQTTDVWSTLADSTISPPTPGALASGVVATNDGRVTLDRLHVEANGFTAIEIEGSGPTLSFEDITLSSTTGGPAAIRSVRNIQVLRSRISGFVHVLDLRPGTNLIGNPSFPNQSFIDSSLLAATGTLVPLDDDVAVRMTNNTMRIETGQSGVTIESNTAQATLVSNLLWAMPGACAVGTVEETGRAEEFESNAVFGGGAARCGANALCGNNFDGDDDNRTCAARAIQSGLRNLDIDPVLSDPEGQDSDPQTLADNDWRLLPSSPCDARQGGRNGTGLLLTDITDTPRTATLTCAPSNFGQGISMGAFELDD